MSVYRQPPPRPTQASRAPWWRIVRAWFTGSLRRIEFARKWRDINRRQRAAGLLLGLPFDKMVREFDEVARAVKEKRW